MQNSHIEQLRSAILQMRQPSDEGAAALLQHLTGIEKELAKADFKILRTLKDKEIAINLLAHSVENLEFSNRQLSLKNEEIGQKNEELNLQKQLLENSRLTLEQNLRELRQSYEALEQFSYVASHDLKTPLRSIASYAQLLQRRYSNQLDDDAKEFIQFIVAGAKHMNDIICDLLEYSRTSIKNQPKTPADVNNIALTVVNNLQEEILKNDAQIVVETLPGRLMVHESGMVQVFQNLISNALKFRGEGPPIVGIKAEKMENKWLFSVSDNGIGIDPQFSHKLFVPFQRLQTNRPGLGMGLAICKKIVQLHQGEIWFEQGSEGGSVFKFTVANA